MAFAFANYTQQAIEVYNLKSVNLQNFNTSKATNLSNMFSYLGNNSTDFTLNLNSFYINNSSVDLSYFAYHMGDANIVFGSGFENANISAIKFNRPKPTNVYYTNTNFPTWNLGNMNYWNTWRGIGNTTFIAGVPGP